MQAYTETQNAYVTVDNGQKEQFLCTLILLHCLHLNTYDLLQET